jgi:hypothetical protein
LSMALPIGSLTTAESGIILGVSPGRILSLIAAGRIDAERFGVAWAVDPASVAAFRRLPRGRPAGSKDRRPRTVAGRAP